MSTLEIAPAPAEAPTRTLPTKLDRKDDQEFADKLRQASSDLEPPPDPPSGASSPPQNSTPTKPTGEVNPNEPNALDLKLDSKSTGKDDPLPSVPGIEIPTALTALAATQPAVTPPVGATPLVPAPTSSPVTPAVASLEVAHPAVKQIDDNKEPDGGKIAADESVGIKVRVLTPEEVKALPDAEPATKPEVEPKPSGEIAIKVDVGNDAGSSSDSHDTLGDKQKPAEKQISAPPTPSPTKESAPVQASKPIDEPKPIDRTLLTRQLADRIELLAAARPKQGVVVMLQPADLGSITLVLSGDKSDLQAHVYSENSRVREALQQGHPDLVQHLSGRGVNLTHLAVSTENRTSASLSNSESWKSPDRNQSQSSSTSSANARPSRELEAAVTAHRPSTSGADGVDLWT